MPAVNYQEVVLGAFLHDIGKLVQRAHGSRANLPAAVTRFESDILPQFNNRPTHIHALWSEAFFHWMEENGLSFPTGINRGNVRNIAVFHHKPDAVVREIGCASWMIAEADRLAAGLDRKPKDEELEQSGNWDQFMRTPLLNPFSSVEIAPELGKVPETFVPLESLHPGQSCMPVASAPGDRLPEQYKALWHQFQKQFTELVSLDHADLFLEAVNSLGECFLHAIPSSTRDQPDVSLYDHSRTTAALAGALHQWHAADGSIEDGARIRDRSLPKFRFLAGDLSGIQKTLFRLARQGAKGVNKVLRARSFLMGMLVESAALDCARRLGVSPFARIQNAGGRFLLLVPDTPQVEDAVQAVRGEIEAWMFRRWRGELALNLALTPAFGGHDLLRDNFSKLQAVVAVAVEKAKLQPFSTCYQAVHSSENYQFGACGICDCRPAMGEGEDEKWRCRECAEEVKLGGDLPKLAAITWSRQPLDDEARYIRLWGGLRLNWHRENPQLSSAVEAGFGLWSGDEGATSPLSLRYFANYVPRLQASDCNNPLYHKLSVEAGDVAAGELKLFEHIAADSLEILDGQPTGQNLLAVIKADVDRLGAIMRQGFKHPSLGLLAGLSRRMDFFFTGYLPELLRTDTRFQSTYMVYAGGDDLLLIGPWRQTCRLLAELRKHFRAWTGGNPQVTISGALELIHASQPLNRSVVAAEEKLEAAKNAGRNRVGAIGSAPMDWEAFEQQLDKAELLLGYLREGAVSQGLVYRLLALDDCRDRLEFRRDAKPGDAMWRAHWGYQLQRNILDSNKLPQAKRLELASFLSGLLGLDSQLGKSALAPLARTAITFAIYRNRKPSERN